jgi:hypothetical protein
MKPLVVNGRETYEKDGTFNDAPKGLRVISEKEFAQSGFFAYEPILREYRQIYRDKNWNNGGCLAIQMYWMDEHCGIAMSNDYYAGKVTYYVFGCQHKYRELSQEECHKRGLFHAGNCYHVYECPDCGHVKSEDSSG